MQPTRLTRSFLVKKQFRHEESSVAWIIPSWIRQRIHGFWLPFASCSTGSRFVVDEFFFLIYLFLPSSLFAGNSTKNFERKIIFIKRGVKFCLTSSISKFDISTIKKILVFSLPWNGWDFFPKIVNPKFLRAQRTFPLQTRRTNWQCKYPTMRKESSSEIQPVHAQHSPSPFRHPESRIVQPHS